MLSHLLSSVYHSYLRSKLKRERKERKGRKGREICSQLILTLTLSRTCWSLTIPREGRLGPPLTSYTPWGCGYQSGRRNSHKIKDSTH